MAIVHICGYFEIFKSGKNVVVIRVDNSKQKKLPLVFRFGSV